MKIQMQSIITCPKCGFQKEENMPADACQYFYECTKCKSILKPNTGDCCFFVLMEMFLAHQFRKEIIVVKIK
jgi:hypothetical protein